LKAGQSTRKRPVYINGVYCESLTSGAREATRILGEEVPLWKIQKVLNGDLLIPGITVSEELPVVCAPLVQKKIVGKPLLRYPPGEGPMDWGNTGARR